MYYDGYNLTQIASRVKKSRAGVRKYLKRLGITFKRILKYTHKYVEGYLKSFGIILLSKYVKTRDKLKCKCFNGHEFLTSFHCILTGTRCRFCFFNKRKVGKQAFQNISDNGFKIISKEYTGYYDNIKVICPFGHYTQFSWCYFKNGRKSGSGCKICKQERIDNNIKLRRIQGIRLRKWSIQVRERDNHKCQKCYKKRKTLNSHHLNAFNWDIENRYNINNGITLCEKCHKEFHKIYGNNNTINEYNQWNSDNKMQHI